MTFKESLDRGIFSHMDAVRDRFGFDKVIIKSAELGGDPLNTTLIIQVSKYGFTESLSIAPPYMDKIDETDILTSLSRLADNLENRIRFTGSAISNKLDAEILRLDGDIASMSSTINDISTKIQTQAALRINDEAMKLCCREVIKHLIDPKGSEWSINFEEDSDKIILESARGKFMLNRTKLIDMFIASEILEALDIE